MRNKFWLAVAGFCLIVSPLPGSDMSPTSLPMGNNLLDWIVGNGPCSVVIVLQSTNAPGSLNTCGMSTNGISFNSYSDFQSYVAVNGLRLFNFLGGQNASCVRLRVDTTYVGLNTQGIQTSCIGLSIDTSLGSTANITANSFAITPTVQSIVLPASGVTDASVQFGTNSYVPLSLAGTNGIVLDNSFVTNSGRSRILLTFSDGKTVIYTQGGNPILPPIISMVWISAPSYPYDGYGSWYWYGYGGPSFNSYNLFVSGSTGADTVVESTMDFISWTPIGSMSWNSGWTSTIMPISTTNYPMQFFRVKSY